MLLSSYAAALAAKKLVPPVSLGALFAAAALPELVFPVLLLSGVERIRIVPGATPLSSVVLVHAPWTHGLAGVLGLAALAGLIGWAWTRWARAALVLSGLVVAHWLLALLVHPPELTVLWPEPTIGLGLWRHPFQAVVVELALFLLGLRVFLRTARPLSRAARPCFLALALGLPALWLAVRLGPPPPSVTAVALAGLGQWLLVAYAYWLDLQWIPTENLMPHRPPLQGT